MEVQRNPINFKNALLSEWLYNDGKITKSGGTYELISTQEHYPIDEKRYNDIHLKGKLYRRGLMKNIKRIRSF